MTGPSAPAGYYFPEPQGQWENVEPADAGWSKAALAEAVDFAGRKASSGLVVVWRGRLLAERYWDVSGALPEGMKGETFAGGRVSEDVASIQKSVVSILIGIAVGCGLLDLDDPVNRHLGSAWSAAPPAAEAIITVRHLLSMTSGLDERTRFAAPAGSQWHYSLGASWHMLKRVLVAASGLDLATSSRRWLFDPLGMEETFWRTRQGASETPDRSYPDGSPFEGLVTSCRDLARFGLAVLAGGSWAGRELGLGDGYLGEALSPSSPLNLSYGFLWWLNGQKSHRLAGAPEVVDGPLIPSAPADLVAAQGAFRRLCHVVPSLDLVVVRLGGAQGEQVLAPSRLPSELWERLSRACPAQGSGLRTGSRL